jgi:hypothetical protein
VRASIRVAGIVIAIVGALFTAFTFTLGAAMDDLRSKEGIGQYFAGIGIWSLVFLSGIILFSIGSRNPKHTAGSIS